MSVIKAYQWDYINPGATVGVYVYGYPQNWVGTYDAIPFAVSGGDAYYPLFKINLTEGEISIHVDGSYARTANVHNLASFNPVGVNLFFLYDGV